MTVRFLFNDSCEPSREASWSPYQVWFVTAGARVDEWQNQELENGNEWVYILFPLTQTVLRMGKLLSAKCVGILGQQIPDNYDRGSIGFHGSLAWSIVTPRNAPHLEILWFPLKHFISSGHKIIPKHIWKMRTQVCKSFYKPHPIPYVCLLSCCNTNEAQAKADSSANSTFLTTNKGKNPRRKKRK